MKSARDVTGLRTKREFVEIGLHTLVRLRSQERIRQFKGGLAWTGDLDELRNDT